MNPISKDTGDRREPELPPALVEEWNDIGIEHETVDPPPEASLEPDRPVRSVASGCVRRLSVIGTEDGWRQMNRGGRNLVQFLEDAREEAERMSHEDRATWLMQPLEPFVCGLQTGADFTQYYSQPTHRVPEIGALRNGIEFFDGHGFLKDEACLPYDVAVRPGGKDDDLMAARPQRAADADERVHVAGRSDWGEDESHRNDTSVIFSFDAYENHTDVVQWAR